MKRLINICISLFLFFMPLLILAYDLLISSDSPVNISFNEVIIFFILNFIYVFLHILYIIKTKSPLTISRLLLIASLSLLWVTNLTRNLKHDYHKYATINSIIALVSIFIILSLHVIKYKKHKKV